MCYVTLRGISWLSRQTSLVVPYSFYTMNAVVILAVCFFALVCAKPQSPNDATIVESFNEVNIDGFKFKFSTSDGTTREETGSIANPGTDNEELSVVGSYSYKDPEGKDHTVTFTADKDGFKPVVS